MFLGFTVTVLELALGGRRGDVVGKMSSGAAPHPCKFQETFRRVLNKAKFSFCPKSLPPSFDFQLAAVAERVYKATARL